MKNLINKKSETKYVSHTVEHQTVHNSGIGAGDVAVCIPALPQGDNDFERLGDSVKPLSMRVRGLLSTNGAAVTDNKVLMARVMILSSKTYKTYTAVNTAAGSMTAALLKPNNDSSGGSPIAFTGDPSDIYQPINKELFRIHYDKVFRLAPSSPEGTEEQPDSCVRWNAKIELPANLDFDESIGNYPTNFAPFMVIGYAYADGTGPDTLTPKLVSYVDSYLKYKDF